MYCILLERGAEKDLARLPSEIHDRVIVAIQAFATNPRPSGCRKLAGSKSDWRIRVGDYRVVYEIAGISGFATRTVLVGPPRGSVARNTSYMSNPL